VVTPFEGWSQTVPNEGNARLILRLDRPVRRGLLVEYANQWDRVYLAPNSRFFQRRLWPWHFLQRLDGPGLRAPQSRHTL